jgi:P27 family predicted phage terminase small subunit
MAGNSRSGRSPKPAAMKHLEGNRGKRKIRAEPVGKGLPQCPDYFTAEQRALWLATVQSAPPNLLCAADGALLEVFAVAWQTLRECNRLISNSTLLIHSERGAVKNPLLSIRRMTVADLNSAASHLGMSPAARARLVAPPEDADDPMALLLGWDDDPSVPWAIPRRQN